jgi:hypothetical protein
LIIQAPFAEANKLWEFKSGDRNWLPDFLRPRAAKFVVRLDYRRAFFPAFAVRSRG